MQRGNKQTTFDGPSGAAAVRIGGSDSSITGMAGAGARAAVGAMGAHVAAVSPSLDHRIHHQQQQSAIASGAAAYHHQGTSHPLPREGPSSMYDGLTTAAQSRFPQQQSNMMVGGMQAGGMMGGLGGTGSSATAGGGGRPSSNTNGLVANTANTTPNGGTTFLETPTRDIVWRRLRVLVSLLILQSLSQVVLQAFESLITINVVVPLFLTMLVGAGGNAGNQAAVTAITGLTSGEIGRWDAVRVIRKEFIVGLICAIALGVMGFIRVYVFYVNEEDVPAPVFTTVFAISLSLFLIVFSSVVLGSALPFLLKRVGANVEHAAPMIQVVMDILGVTICCVICSMFLPQTLPIKAPPEGVGVGGIAGGGLGGGIAATIGVTLAPAQPPQQGANAGGGDVLEVLVGN